MRRERQSSGDSQDLLDLGGVAVRAHAVGLKVFVGKAEVRPLGGLLPRPGNTGNRVGHHDAAFGHQAAAKGGSGGKRGGRGIAAGAGHDHGLARRAVGGGARKLVARQLGQPERRLREQARCGVGRLVPCLKDGRILEPEVGREVDHAYAAGDEPGRQAERRRVRHCQKGHVAAVEGGLVERTEGKVGHAGESGVRLRDRRAGQCVGGDRNQLEVGVTHEQAHELDARETGRADH